MMTPPSSPRAAEARGRRRVVIVGGGQAAGAALRTLRLLDYPGPVTLLSDEAHPPYERPPLSKEHLQGKEKTLRWIAPGGGPNERLAIGCAAVSGDARARTITCSDGSTIAYDVLLLATGGLPRRLAVPGGDLARVHGLRSASDCVALRQSIERCAQERRRLLVVGGSWIGLEVAASARAAGIEVTLLEQAPRLCGRTLSEEGAHWLHQLHASNGVDLRLNTSIVRIDGDSEAQSAKLSDGSELSVGAIAVGIGITPNIALGEGMGLHVRSGIVVDPYGLTSMPDIYAAGDVAEQACPWHGASMRIETWENANRQGEAAARHIAGVAVEPGTARRTAPPWFWSDQYGFNLQVLGAPTCGDAVLTSMTGEHERLFIHLRSGAVVGATGINKTKDMRRLRKLLTERPVVRASDLTAEGLSV